MVERTFKKRLVREIKRLWPEAIVLSIDPTLIRSFPDVLILFGDRWAALELKSRKGAAVRPNQEHYVEQLNNMSFARFIYPDNMQEVLDELGRFISEEG